MLETRYFVRHTEHNADGDKWYYNQESIHATYETALKEWGKLLNDKIGYGSFDQVLVLIEDDQGNQFDKKLWKKKVVVADESADKTE